MSHATAFHPAFVTDSPFFVDDCPESGGAMGRMPIAPYKGYGAVNADAPKVSGLVHCRTLKVRGGKVIEQDAPDIHARIEPATPEWEPEYAFCLQEHIEDIAGVLLRYGMQDYLHDFHLLAAPYLLRVKGSAAGVDCDDIEYRRPLIERIRGFERVSEGWDGEGSVPASEQTATQAIAFVQNLPLDQIRRPSAVLGGDGTIGLVWQNAEGRFATADFAGMGEYAVLIDDCGVYSGEDSVPVAMIYPELLDYVRRYFPR